ncbi:BMC domain-containing protein [Alkaliphilus crotonatoxidans]
MKKSIGLIEFKSIAKGIEATDAMLKAANIALTLATPICPGKYITIVSGDVGAVNNAIEVGRLAGAGFTIDDEVIANISEEVFEALTGTIEIEKITSIGIIETISAITSMIAGDVAVKAANVRLLEIRLARGLGGKAFVIFTGEVAAVKQAIDACEISLRETGSMISGVTIPSPSPDLLSKLV